MSGFARGTDRGPYELTPTKATSWHGYRGCCRGPDEIVDRHVRPLFAVEDKRSSWVVAHATLEAGSTNMLYTAISGDESNQPPYPSGRAVP